MIKKTDECFICGESVPSVDEHSIPFCIDCVMSEMPKALANAVLADDQPGCSFSRLQNAWNEVEKNYWKEAALVSSP